jgi:hypothetical protein
LAETDLAILEQRQRKFCAANIDCKRIDAWSGLLICDGMSHDLPALVVIKCRNSEVLPKTATRADDECMLRDKSNQESIIGGFP